MTVDDIDWLVPHQANMRIINSMDVESLQATGKSALWPLYDEWDHLNEWLDITQVEAAYQTASHSAEDIRPLRKLQSVQTLAYRLMNSTI